MPLVDMCDMLNHAYRNNYAVGGFNLVSLDFLESIMDAAEHCRSPVILSLAESHFEYYDFELAIAATEKAAHRAHVPVAIHLDHGMSFDSAVRAIKLGCNGVMVDRLFPARSGRSSQYRFRRHRCHVDHLHRIDSPIGPGLILRTARFSRWDAPAQVEGV